VVLLLLGATTLALTAAAVTKANRFTVTGLPLVAALAAFFPAAWLGPTRRALAVLAGAVALSVLLSLHNSFSILPVASFRLGDLRLLDDRFPLNVPDWFDDNRPLNRADLRWEGVVQAVAADARSHFLPGTRIRVRLAEHGLLINHDWLNFVARRHGLPLDFSWWYGTELYGPDAPDYILDAQGLDRLAPGRHFFDFVPELRKEIDAGHLPYRLAGRWAGPGGSELTWYRSTLAPVDPSAPLRHVREAEAFERGTAVVDRDQWGLGIGVLITPPGLSNTEVEYHLILPHPGLYRVDLRLASAEPRPLQVEVDGRLISGVVGGDVTGGFLPANQAWVRGFVFFSDSNEVGLRIQRHGPFPHIDRIQVAPID